MHVSFFLGSDKYLSIYVHDKLMVLYRHIYCLLVLSHIKLKQRVNTFS
jgi:hypothetical protein